MAESVSAIAEVFTSFIRFFSWDGRTMTDAA
jgi:hypothetical protein